MDPRRSKLRPGARSFYGRGAMPPRFRGTDRRRTETAAGDTWVPETAPARLFLDAGLGPAERVGRAEGPRAASGRGGHPRWETTLRADPAARRGIHRVSAPEPLSHRMAAELMRARTTPSGRTWRLHHMLDALRTRTPLGEAVQIAVVGGWLRPGPHNDIDLVLVMNYAPIRAFADPRFPELAARFTDWMNREVFGGHPIVRRVHGPHTDGHGIACGFTLPGVKGDPENLPVDLTLILKRPYRFWRSNADVRTLQILGTQGRTDYRSEPPRFGLCTPQAWVSASALYREQGLVVTMGTQALHNPRSLFGVCAQVLDSKGPAEGLFAPGVLGPLLDAMRPLMAAGPHALLPPLYAYAGEHGCPNLLAGLFGLLTRAGLLQSETDLARTLADAVFPHRRHAATLLELANSPDAVRLDTDALDRVPASALATLWLAGRLEPECLEFCASEDETTATAGALLALIIGDRDGIRASDAPCFERAWQTPRAALQRSDLDGPSLFSTVLRHVAEGPARDETLDGPLLRKLGATLAALDVQSFRLLLPLYVSAWTAGDEVPVPPIRVDESWEGLGVGTEWTPLLALFSLLGRSAPFKSRGLRLPIGGQLLNHAASAQQWEEVFGADIRSGDPTVTVHGGPMLPSYLAAMWQAVLEVPDVVVIAPQCRAVIVDRCLASPEQITERAHFRCLLRGLTADQVRGLARRARCSEPGRALIQGLSAEVEAQLIGATETGEERGFALLAPFFRALFPGARVTARDTIAIRRALTAQLRSRFLPSYVDILAASEELRICVGSLEMPPGTQAAHRGDLVAFLCRQIGDGHPAFVAAMEAILLWSPGGISAFELRRIVLAMLRTTPGTVIDLAPMLDACPLLRAPAAKAAIPQAVRSRLTAHLESHPSWGRIVSRVFTLP